MPPAPVIGLEVHVQLATGRKMFCRCPTGTGESEGSVCPVCAGFPGALPVLDREVVGLGLRVARSVGARVSRQSGFDRKSYFYPDLPRGYQITQHATPLATGGALPLLRSGRAVPLRRLHLEEDAGRRIALEDGRDAIDLGRAGTPLLEIVTEPALRSASEAQDFLRTLCSLVRALGVGDAAMEDGSLRCDVNVSLADATTAGTRTEIKNLNSFRFVGRAVEAEVRRQQTLLARGDSVEAVTLGYDEVGDSLTVQRSKESGQDYRFFPEPDLGPIRLREEEVRSAREPAAELPWQVLARLLGVGIDRDTALVFVESPSLGAVLARVQGARRAGSSWAETADWIRSEVVAALRARGEEADPEHLPAARIAELLDAVDSGRLSRRAAKELLPVLWEQPGVAIEELAEGRGLLLVTDGAQLRTWVREVLEAHPEPVTRYRAGRAGVLGFLVGRVLELSGGAGDPIRVREILGEELGDPG